MRMQFVNPTANIVSVSIRVSLLHHPLLLLLLLLFCCLTIVPMATGFSLGGLSFQNQYVMLYIIRHRKRRAYLHWLAFLPAHLPLIPTVCINQRRKREIKLGFFSIAHKPRIENVRLRKNQRLSMLKTSLRYLTPPKTRVVAKACLKNSHLKAHKRTTGNKSRKPINK